VLLSLEEKEKKKKRIARKSERVEACKERLKEKARHRKACLEIERSKITLQRLQAMFYLLPVKAVANMLFCNTIFTF